MARVPQVTRTILTTKAIVSCIDTEKEVLIDKEFTLPRTYKDDRAILKAVTARNEDANIRPAYVKSVDVCSTVYGMTEEKFIEYAEILPPRKINDIA